MKKIDKNKKIVLIATLVICILLILTPYICTSIKLIGKETIEINYNETFKDEGAVGSFFGIPVKVKEIGKIDTKILGTQEKFYQIKNKIGVIKKSVRTVKVVDKTPPIITLEGDANVVIKTGEEYKELGYKMIDDHDGDITKDVKIKNNINTKKEGIYEIIYTGQDKSKNKATIKRNVKVENDLLIYKEEYNNIDNSPKTWWDSNKKNSRRPEISLAATSEELKKYDAYYIGPDEKTIYLTFDEGSNATYVKEIAEILNKNNVKGTFFFCGHYIKSNPDVIRFLAESGHSIGNHTVNHKSMYNFANNENFDTFIKEIKGIEDLYYKITGKQMDKVYREPRGDWSFRDLQIVKDMGYKSFFWSASYLDFEKDTAKDAALNALTSRHHNGAIYLIHPKNKGNYEAMDDFIKNMKELGYNFGLVKDIK